VTAWSRGGNFLKNGWEWYTREKENNPLGEGKKQEKRYVGKKGKLGKSEKGRDGRSLKL